MSKEDFMVGQLRAIGISTIAGGQTINVKMRDDAGDILLATGTTVPSGSSAGFAKGCIFIDTNVAAGTTGFYTNNGTNLLCNFVASEAVAGTDASVLTSTVTSLQTSEDTYDSQLLSRITSEIADRGADESTITSKLTSEIADRGADESTISSTVTSEISDRAADESTITSVITSGDARESALTSKVTSGDVRFSVAESRITSGHP
jgi:hypothetical protein